MTPSAMLADYVFPVTHWLEMPVMHPHTLEGNGNQAALGERVVEPLYERKPDYYFYQGLGVRLGQEKYWRKTLEEEWDWVLEPLLKELNIASAEEFARKVGRWSPPRTLKRYETIDPVTGKPRGFATPTGKVELFSTILEKLGYDPLPYYEEPAETPLSNPGLAKDYPLVLLTGSRFRPIFHSEHRQIPSIRKFYPYPTVQINPETANKLDIHDEDWVFIETVRGRIKQKANLTSNVHPKMVEIQHAWWFPEKESAEPVLFGVFESNANVLTPDGDEYLDPPLGGASFTPLLCRIYPAEEKR
jgi:anaerobic selenocysteine-containing dehydrogenase